MKNRFNNDKVIKFTSFLIVLLLIFFVVLLIPSSTKSHQIVNDTIFVKNCGLTKENSVILYNGNLVHDSFFSFPYNAIEIKADDYFSLKYGNRSRPIFDGPKTNEEYSRYYYTTAIFKGNQSGYYSAILKQFQKIKSIYNLNDDEYLQLIVNFVQSMPYFTEKPDVKYPFITFVDGCGDCDDKCLLLLALLSQENYNVSILNIPTGPNLPGHSVAGVASHFATSTRNGYVMIDTTKKDSAIGVFPLNVMSEQVQVIKIGNGTKTYETHSLIAISEEGQFRVIKKADKTVSITPYPQEFELLDFFRIQKENFDWQTDCENGQIPMYLCHSESF